MVPAANRGRGLSFGFLCSKLFTRTMQSLLTYSIVAVLVVASGTPPRTLRRVIGSVYHIPGKEKVFSKQVKYLVHVI